MRFHHLVRGKPRERPIGGFEEWSLRVREALIYYGEPDPWLSADRIRDDSPDLENLRRVIAQWKTHLGVGANYTVKALADFGASASQENPGALLGNNGRPDPAQFHETMMIIAGRNGVIQTQKLGNWLGQHKQQVIDGLCIVRKGKYDGIQQWALEVSL